MFSFSFVKSTDHALFYFFCTFDFVAGAEAGIAFGIVAAGLSTVEAAASGMYRSNKYIISVTLSYTCMKNTSPFKIKTI